MPTYIFSCENDHSIEKVRLTPYRRRRRYRCKVCGLWQTRDYVKEAPGRKKDLHLDYKKDPISHLASKRSFKGVTIEHLTPEPVFVRTKAQYDNLLKATNSREKGA